MDYNGLFKRFPEMQTERLCLKEINIEDCDSLFQIYSDFEAMKYYGLDCHKTKEETCDSIRQMSNGYNKRWILKWGLSLKNSNKLIGVCGFHNWSKRDHRSDIGYIMSPAFWGNGYMSEALNTILNTGVDRMDLNRIEAKVHTQNTRSMKLLEKFNFHNEGILRQYKFTNGKFEDYYIYSCLRDSDYTINNI